MIGVRPVITMFLWEWKKTVPHCGIGETVTRKFRALLVGVIIIDIILTTTAKK